MRTIKTRAARAAGYRALTLSYDLGREKALLEKVLSDMRRGNIDHVLVATNEGLAVWRRGSGRSACAAAGRRARTERRAA